MVVGVGWVWGLGGVVMWGGGGGVFMARPKLPVERWRETQSKLEQARPRLPGGPAGADRCRGSGPQQRLRDRRICPRTSAQESAAPMDDSGTFNKASNRSSMRGCINTR